MNFNTMHPADQIVEIMNRIYYNGMTTTSGGNLSIIDSDGTIWISPSGVDKGTLRREDIMQIKKDGSIVGIHKPSVEYPFHCSIYKKRPDLKAVLHAHPPALVAFSIIREVPDTTIIPDVSKLCGDITIAKYALPGSQTLGDNISAEFENGKNAVILENHGVVIGSDKGLFQAFMMFEAFDYCARTQIYARTLGQKIRSLTSAELESFNRKTIPDFETFKKTEYTSEEQSARRDMCTLIHRAYGNQLFTSDQGSFSCRLSDGSFIITPSGKDRLYLEPEDLVQIKDGKCEEGKIPSRSVHLHQALYAKRDDVHTIILAHPAHIMAFAITDAVFDARLIPESYIMLRTVKKFPFGSTLNDIDTLTEYLSMKNPVAIIEKDCIIALGTSLLNAFDRLEVLEYSAKSLVDTASIGGNVVKISSDEVKEIEVAFNL